MTSQRNLFAVIPAAGLSRRMGEPKLLLPLGETTVIRRLLGVLDSPQIANRVVVLRRIDDALRREVAAAGATLVAPEEPPPDMRSSVQHALDFIRAKHSPSHDDGWMLIPADHPLLDVALLAQLADAWSASNADILIPTCNGRRGHPTFFRWPLAKEVPTIPRDKGLNQLVRWHEGRIEEIETGNPAILYDLDTPEDYEALCRQS